MHWYIWDNDKLNSVFLQDIFREFDWTVRNIENLNLEIQKLLKSDLVINKMCEESWL